MLLPMFGVLFYWLWRLRVRLALSVPVRHDSMPLAQPT
jgi:hypothetical protein